MARLVCLVLVVISIISYAECYKILSLFPMPSKSHDILGKGYVRVLTEAGHEVTYITSYPEDPPPKHYRQIDVSHNTQITPDSVMNLTQILNNEIDPLDFNVFLGMLVKLGNATFGNPNVLKLLHDENEKFDAVIVEWLYSDIGAGLADIFDCPLIWSSSVDPHWMVLSLIDENLNPAYSADIMSNVSPPFTFYERVKELFMQFVGTYFRNYQLGPREEEIYNQYFGPIMAKKGRPLTSYWEKKYQAALILGNSHVSLGSAIRLPQNYIPIAGYHIDPKLKPLPENLKKIIEESKHGVIYFSMGSNLKSKDLPDFMKRQLLEMFGGLKYTVLWKFEEDLPNVPKNVHILKWAPQPSILAHPNTKLFITHGGLLSTTEAVHYGVPIIGIPGFADQFINVKRAVKKGFAKEVSLSYDLVKDLKAAIEDMVENPKYNQKLKQLSQIYHDRVVPPSKELVFWVEHVIKTGGAPHLASPALHVPIYQKLYLDLLLLVIIVLFIVKVIVKKVFRVVYEKTTKSKRD